MAALARCTGSPSRISSLAGLTHSVLPSFASRWLMPRIGGTLVQLFDITVPSRHSCYLAWPENVTPSDKILAFREWLLAERDRSGQVLPPAPEFADNASDLRRGKRTR